MNLGKENGKPKGLAGLSKTKVRQIAKMGGEAVSAQEGHMSKLGKTGGKLLVEKRGKEYMAEIGRRGGMKGGRRKR